MPLRHVSIRCSVRWSSCACRRRACTRRDRQRAPARRAGPRRRAAVRGGARRRRPDAAHRRRSRRRTQRRADARRGHGPRARAQPRHRGRAPESADFRTSTWPGCAPPTGRRSRRTIGHRAARAAADQPVERRQHRPERHVDLQHRHHAGAAVGRRQLRVPVQQQQAGHARTSSPTSTRRSTPTSAPPSRSRCCATSGSTARGSSCGSRRSTATSRRSSCGARWPPRVANVRNAYWELVFAVQAVDVASGSLDLADKLVRGQPRPRRGRHAWRRSTSCRPRPKRPRAARRWRRPRRRWRTAELALKRLIVNGTDDPLWRAHASRRSIAPSSARSRSTSKAPCARRSQSRTDLEQARKTHRQQRRHDASSCATRRCRRSTSSANYGAQGLGGTQFIRQGRASAAPGHRHDSRRLRRRVAHAHRPRLPDLELAGELQLSARRQRRRRAATRARACSATSRPRSCARSSCRWPPTSPTPRCRWRAA